MDPTRCKQRKTKESSGEAPAAAKPDTASAGRTRDIPPSVSNKMANSDLEDVIIVYVSTSLDTHFATDASPHDTLASLKAKLVALHLSIFPAFGTIRIESLVTRKEGVSFHMTDSSLVAHISHGTEGPCHLKALVVSEPEARNTDKECEKEVQDPLSASADSTLTPLKAVDEENVNCRAREDSTLIVRPEDSVCSKCASVREELKKVKIRENFLNKKLSVKSGTITKLRKMLEEAENREKGVTSQVLSLQSALKSSEERVQKTEASLKEMERKLMESDMRANKAEAKCAEADAMARNAKAQLLEADVRAQKCEVKACKFEVKLIEAEVWTQKANAELANAEKRARELEDKLMEALDRARSAEAKLTEIDVKLEEPQRKALNLRVEGGEATLMQAVASGRIKKEH